uniref:Sulfite exporter TauE-SafE n=1 Tax=Trepomonas sp. PC1 TaxID=1076344 RepID=A0A146KBL4_9EUKA|eukprot:JAP92769.1 Sulfite exporter TauE - SafE [Trepomonas sp. PC1]
MYFKLVSGLNLVGEIISLVIIGIQSIIAAAGGVGGGPVYSTVLIAFGASAHTAIPMSKTIIFSGSLVIMIINTMEKSKTDKNKPAIMWDMVFFIENSTIMGAVAGSILNAVMPEWFLIVFGFLFFTAEGLNTTIKAVKAIKKDRIKFKDHKTVHLDDLIKAEQTPSQPTGGLTLLDQNLQGDIVKEEEKEQITRCSHIKYINKLRFSLFVVGLILSLTFTILRGVVKKCSYQYWLFVGLTFVFGIIITLITNHSLKRSILKNEKTVLTGSTSSKMSEQLTKFTIIGFFIGVLAACMGIGGGIVQVPLMLSMGVPPYVTRLASSTMITFTAFASMVQYSVMGLLDFEEVWVFMIVVGIFFPIGYFISTPIMKCVKSTSFISLAMGLGILIADTFIIFRAVTTIIEMVETKVVPGFNDIC